MICCLAALSSQLVLTRKLLEKRRSTKLLIVDEELSARVKHPPYLVPIVPGI